MDVEEACRSTQEYEELCLQTTFESYAQGAKFEAMQPAYWAWLKIILGVLVAAIIIFAFVFIAKKLSQK